MIHVSAGASGACALNHFHAKGEKPSWGLLCMEPVTVARPRRPQIQDLEVLRNLRFELDR